MSENQEQIKAKIEIQPSDPKLWDTEDQDSVLGFFKLLIEIDMKNNPENYKLKSNQSISISYESNQYLRNSNNTRQS